MSSSALSKLGKFCSNCKDCSLLTGLGPDNTEPKPYVRAEIGWFWGTPPRNHRKPLFAPKLVDSGAHTEKPPHGPKVVGLGAHPRPKIYGTTPVSEPKTGGFRCKPHYKGTMPQNHRKTLHQNSWIPGCTTSQNKATREEKTSNFQF